MEDITTNSTLVDNNREGLSAEGAIQVTPLSKIPYPTVAPKQRMSIQDMFAKKEREDAELRKNPPPRTMTPTQEELLATAIDSANTSMIETSQATPQMLSAYDARLGQIPEGYALSQSCATCEYYSGGLSNSGGSICVKYDFPCASYYICSSYEQGSSDDCCELWDEAICAYAIPINISKATNEQLLLLSDAADINAEVLDVDKGVLYVKDESSADLVRKNMSILAGVSQQVVLSVLSKYKQNSPKTPSKPLLFKLANGNYNNYEQLYTSKYGSLTGCYTELEVTDIKDKLDLVKLSEQYPSLYDIATSRANKLGDANQTFTIFEGILRERGKL